MSPIPAFKVRPLFDAEYLTTGTRETYTRILIGTYAIHFE